MKRGVFFVVLAFLMVVLMSVSCRSKPAPVESRQVTGPAQAVESPPAQVPDRPAQVVERPPEVPDRQEQITERPVQAFDDPVVVEARTRAEAARFQAIDFRSPVYFPSEWEAIEARFQAADNAEAYNAASIAFDELFRRTLPLYAQGIEDEIMGVRTELISTGLTIYYPEGLIIADQKALDALDQYESGDYISARNTAALALIDYQDMLLAANVYLTREEIINRNFVRFDRDNFIVADDMAFTAIDEFEDDNIEAARFFAQEASLRYNVVLLNGWNSYVRNRRLSASVERELAVIERADIASRETFREGDVHMSQAERLFAAESFHDSSLNFIEAEALFAISRIETRERRLRAEEAIRMAEEAIEQSNEAAIEAERVIEGGSLR